MSAWVAAGLVIVSAALLAVEAITGSTLFTTADLTSAGRVYCGIVAAGLGWFGVTIWRDMRRNSREFAKIRAKYRA